MDRGLVGKAFAAPLIFMLLFGVNCANGVGILVAILGLIMVLWSVNDLVMLPRRLAMCLYSVLLGQLLAKAVFGPIARRLS
ncbi:MAG: hypothetical protein HY922_02690 [Elusimicrobia bacterium]|nr:hypothetical protein [Elusimicrobiota bacterium]